MNKSLISYLDHNLMGILILSYDVLILLLVVLLIENAIIVNMATPTDFNQSTGSRQIQTLRQGQEDDNRDVIDLKYYPIQSIEGRHGEFFLGDENHPNLNIPRVLFRKNHITLLHPTSDKLPTESRIINGVVVKGVHAKRLDFDDIALGTKRLNVEPGIFAFLSIQCRLTSGGQTFINNTVGLHKGLMQPA